MGFYKVKSFDRFARRHRLLDKQLVGVAGDLLKGRVDADLGGGVYKQRVGKAGAGKSGGFRVILVHRAGRHVFFVLGFEKSDRGNVSLWELKALKRQATVLSGLSDQQISQAVAAGALVEVGYEEKGA